MDAIAQRVAVHPFWQLLNPSEVGLAGHSYGAAGVSYIGQRDPRVKAIVAWDNLGGPGPNAGSVPGSHQGRDRHRRADHPPWLAPGLQLHPQPGLRRIAARSDMIDWYTSAWFDKYLRHDASADKRLLTQRWRHDPVQKSIDPGHDPNVFSFHHYSRLDIHPVQRQDVPLRGHARGLSGDGRQRRLLLHVDRHEPGWGQRGGCEPEALGDLHKSSSGARCPEPCQVMHDTRA